MCIVLKKSMRMMSHQIKKYEYRDKIIKSGQIDVMKFKSAINRNYK